MSQLKFYPVSCEMASYVTSIVENVENTGGSFPLRELVQPAISSLRRPLPRGIKQSRAEASICMQRYTFPAAGTVSKSASNFSIVPRTVPNLLHSFSMKRYFLFFFFLFFVCFICFSPFRVFVFRIFSSKHKTLKRSLDPSISCVCIRQLQLKWLGSFNQK